jgi:hypothetical protein
MAREGAEPAAAVVVGVAIPTHFENDVRVAGQGAAVRLSGVKAGNEWSPANARQLVERF